MMILADPDPQSLLKALDTAIESVGAVNAWKQHREVKEMYSWHRVAERTEAVYDEVMQRRRDDSFYARLVRAYKTGGFAGKLFSMILSLHHLYSKFLELWDPVSEIDEAPDFPKHTG